MKKFIGKNLFTELREGRLDRGYVYITEEDGTIISVKRKITVSGVAMELADLAVKSTVIYLAIRITGALL